MEDSFKLFGILVCFEFLKFGFDKTFGSYFTEWGKNKALLNDIQKLTSLVEEVKSNQQTSTHLRISRINEEKEAIKEFNENYFLWLSFLTNSDLGGINKNDEFELVEYLKKIDTAKRKVIANHIKLNFFIDNEDLYTSSIKIFQTTLNEVAIPIQAYIIDLKDLNYQIKTNSNLFDETVRNKVLLDLRHKQSVIEQKCQKEISDGFQKLNELHKQYNKICRTHISILIEANN